jgi:hypothetical protein
VRKVLRNSVTGLIGVLAAPILTAGAQPLPPPAEQPSIRGQPSPPPGQKRAAPPSARAAPSVNGTWTGPVTQVGSETKYTIVLKLTGSGGTSNYPELNCTGKLTRIGASHSYVFYIEVITEGQREKGGRCPDGTITVARASDNLDWGWFASVDGEIGTAYGTLTRKPEP